MVHYIQPFTDTNIHTAMVEETMRGTNLGVGSNQGFRLLLKNTPTLTLREPTGEEL